MQFEYKKFNLAPSVLNIKWKALIIKPSSINKNSLKWIIQLLKSNKSISIFNLKLQRLYDVQYWFGFNSKINKMNEEEFKKSYHPTHKFNRGIIKLYHDDLQP